MNDFGFNQLEILKKRFISEGIDINDKSIIFIINNPYLDGEVIENGIAISKDKRWLCVPIHDESIEASLGDYCFKPKCFEIDLHCTTFLLCGEMNVLTDVYLLNR